MAVQFYDLSRLHGDIKDDLLKSVSDVVHNNSYILGPAVRRFEENFAQAIGSKHGIGVNSGTDALLMTLHALGIQAGDEVICPVYTFVATADAIVRTGATPVFVDIDDDYNMNVEAVRASVTENTRAVMAVHLYGKAADVVGLQQICTDYGLHLIEDCAQATGASVNGRRVGTFGIAGCFSFYPTKNLGGFGDGGMVTTDNEELADRLRLFRDHGKGPEGTFQAIAYNSRLSSIQAAMLDVKLPNLDEDNADRQANAEFYNSKLDPATFGLPLPGEDPDSHVYNQYTLRHPMRDQLRNFLSERQIMTGLYYARPLHLEPCFEYLGYVEGHFPNAEAISKEILQLPVGPGLTRKELDEVAHAVELFAKSYATPAS